MRSLGSLLVVLTVLVAGCAAQVQIMVPPDPLMQPCRYEEDPPKTNGELLRSRNGLWEALKLCDADKEALREWARKAQERP